MTKRRWLLWSALSLSFLLALPLPALSQRTNQKTTSGPVIELKVTSQAALVAAA